MTYHLAYSGTELEVTVELPLDATREWRVPNWRLGAVPLALDAGGEARIDAEGHVRLPPGARRLRYSYPLAAGGGGLMGGAGAPGGHVLAGRSYLLKPEPLDRSVAVTIVADPQLCVLPWELDQGRARLRGADLLWTGFHTFGGRHHTLVHERGRLELTVLPGRDPAGDAALVEWVRRSWEELLTCAPRFAAPRLAVTLVPVPGSRRISFGQLLRSDPPTIAIYVGADAGAKELRRDWVAVHELAHSLHPRFEPKIHWLTEGLGTYFQIVARIRSGRLTPAESWGQFEWGVAQGRGEARGQSLESLSEAMHRTHAYRAVYWGGALLVLDLDLAIREASEGARSLDDAVASLVARGPRARLEDFAHEVDAAAGSPVYAEVSARHLQGVCLSEGARLLGALGVSGGHGKDARLTEGLEGGLRRGLERSRN